MISSQGRILARRESRRVVESAPAESALRVAPPGLPTKALRADPRDSSRHGPPRLQHRATLQEIWHTQQHKSDPRDSIETRHSNRRPLSHSQTSWQSARTTSSRRRRVSRVRQNSKPKFRALSSRRCVTHTRRFRETRSRRFRETSARSLVNARRANETNDHTN